MTLSINTEEGAEYRAHHQRAALIYTTRFDNIAYVMTPPRSDCHVDAVLVEDRKVVAVVEHKSREMTLKKLRGDYDNEWLITYRKLLRGRLIAHTLRVPLVGFCFLIPDDLLLIKRLTHPPPLDTVNKTPLAKLNNWACEYRVEPRQTQRSILGGEKTELCALVKMVGAHALSGGGW